MERISRRGWTSALMAAACVSLGVRAEAQHYQETKLVSDETGVATVTDTHLVNPWGLARSSTSPWWVANNHSGTSTLYNGSGVPQPAGQPLVVTIPSANGSDPGFPTGTVFNGTSDFELAPTRPARFLFVTEDGTVSGWNPAVDATNAVIKARQEGAVYKGVAIAVDDGKRYLYAANFAQQRIDVFDTAFAPVPRREHRFEDERLGAKGYGPFNVQNIGGDLYVAFALRDPQTNDEVAGAGLGAVDVFSPSGHLLRRLEPGPWLNAPWGLALAPGDFGAFGHNLLVGQFGSGQIAAYDLASGRFLGLVRDPADAVLSIEGLWALAFGNGANAGPLNTLFFTAGTDDEQHGLFGTLTPIAAEQVLGNSR